MIEKIEQLIRRGSLSDALSNIEKNLDNYFNLSKKSQMQKYLKLHSLRKKVLDKLGIAKKNKKGVYAKGEGNVWGYTPGAEEKTVSVRTFNKDEFPHEHKFHQLLALAKTEDDTYKKTLESLAYEIDCDDKPIVLYGATGTGKQLTVELIHKLSKRRAEAFESVNCAKVTINNIYQILYGAKKGTYTDAKQDMKGKIDFAAKGTLFIDEINRSSPEVRGTLLEFIEYKKYEPLGEPTRTADVRVILGTNIHPEVMVDKGLMEEDFFYRIKSRIFELPPLSKRKKDIDLFIQWYLEEFNKEKKANITIDEQAINFFRKYDWPGNLRELSSYLDNLLTLSLRKKLTTVTMDMVMENLPIKKDSIRDRDIKQFESLLLKLLEQWDPQRGDFISEFLHPALAKIYMEDYNPELSRAEKLEMASKIIGISGLNRNTSTLIKLLSKYYQ